MSNLRHLIRGISQLDVKPKSPDSEVTKYEKYIARLKAPISLQESILTACKLVSWINQYQLGNPSQPWLVSRRLVRADMPSNARLAGLDLFKACVESRVELPVVVRLMFFNDIEGAFTKEDFDLQIDAFLALSKDGRDISGFEVKVCPFLAKWVDRALINLDSRKPLIRRLVPVTIQERHEELRAVVFLITNIMKFHFSVLEEENVSILVERIVFTCKRTGEIEDIQAALGFIDTIIRYGYIPANVLAEIVNVVCSVYHGLLALRESALLVMVNLLKSHMSQGTLHALRDVVLGRSNVHDDVVLGALEILTTRWSGSAEEHASYTFTVETLFQTYKDGLLLVQPRSDRNQVLIDTGYLHSITDILRNTSVPRGLSFDDWDVLFDIFAICKRSLYKETSSVESENIKDAFLRLLSILETLSIDHGVHLPVYKLADLWNALSPILSTKSALELLKYHGDQLTFYPSNPFWLQDIRRVGVGLFFNINHAQIVRDTFVRQICDILPVVVEGTDRQALHSTLLEICSQLGQEPRVQGSDETNELIIAIFLTGSDTHANRAMQILATLLRCPMSTTVNAQSVSSDVKPSSTKNDDTTLSTDDSGKALESSASHETTIQPSDALPIELSLATTLSHTFVRISQERNHVLVSKLFDLLCMIIKDSRAQKRIRIQFLTLLSTVRADSEHFLYMDTPKDATPAHAKAIPFQYEGSQSWYSCRDTTAKAYLAIDRYFHNLYELVLDESDPEVNLVAVKTFKAQLSNRPLFVHSHGTIKLLRKLICDRLSISRSFPILNAPEHKQDEIVIHYVDLLAMLIGHHEHFSKVQEDEIVAALQNTLMRYQKATQACIRTFTICAYELPLSTTKILSTILLRLSQLVTSTTASLHILELLYALATLPSLYINFREDDYRRAFGIALQHIQHANAIARDALAAGQPDPLAEPMTAYVFTLSFDSLYAWFLALKLSQRPKYLKWIVDGLLAANPQTRALDSKGLVCYDFLARFCYSNSEVRNSTSILRDFEPDQSSTKSWLHGHAIVTMKTMNLSGLTEIIVRRPSGSTSYLCKPNSDLEALSIISSVDAKNIVTSNSLVGPTESKIRSVIAGMDNTAFTPSHILLQTSIAPELYRNQHPTLLIEDETTRRSLATLDRIPVVDFHKIGIIYIGRGQYKQSEILANTYGSPEYVQFLEGLGDLVRLKDNNSIYTGGLDVHANEDGEFAYAYREKIRQVIFHTCTLMPYSPDTDPESNRKKSHIGNDFVKIIWNSSNRPYDLHTIPSEFNFINIVVSPDAYQTASSTDSAAPKSTGLFYKVKLVSVLEILELSPVVDWRLISAIRVSEFVRTIAIQCNIYAQIHHARGSYMGNWNQRLERIDVLKTRTSAKASDSIVEDITSHGYDFTTYN